MGTPDASRKQEAAAATAFHGYQFLWIRQHLQYIADAADAVEDVMDAPDTGVRQAASEASKRRISDRAAKWAAWLAKDPDSAADLTVEDVSDQ